MANMLQISLIPSGASAFCAYMEDLIILKNKHDASSVQSLSPHRGALQPEEPFMAGPLLRQCRAFVTLASLGSNDVTFFFFFFQSFACGFVLVYFEIVFLFSFSLQWYDLGLFCVCWLLVKNDC